MKEIDSAAVVGVYHPKWDERPIAVVTLAKGQSSTALLEKASGSSNLLQHVTAAQRAFRHQYIAVMLLFPGILTSQGSWTPIHLESLGYTLVLPIYKKVMQVFSKSCLGGSIVFCRVC